MPIIKMPDGQLVRFPDDMPPQRVAELVASKYPNEVQHTLEQKGKADNPFVATGKMIYNIPSNLASGVSGLKQFAAEGVAGDPDALEKKIGPDFKINDPSITTMDQQNILKWGAQRLGLPAASTQATDMLGEYGWPDAAQVAKIEAFIKTPEGKAELLAVLRGKDPNYTPMGTPYDKVKAAQEAGRKERAGIEAARVPVNVVPNSIIGSVEGGVSSFVEMAPSLAASVLLRNPMPAILQGTLMQSGESYGRGRDLGLSTFDAATYAAGQGLAEGIFEGISVGQLLKFGFGSFVKELGEQIVTEGGTEMLTAATQAALDKGYITPDMTWSEAWSRIQSAGIGGAVGGTLMHTGVHGPGALFGKDKIVPDDKASPTFEKIVGSDFGSAAGADPGVAETLGNVAAQPAAIIREKRLALPAPEATLEDTVSPIVARQQTIAVPPTPEQLAQKVAERTRATLDVAREVTTPVGSFTMDEVGPDVAGKVNLWRMRTGRQPDAPVTVADMKAAKVEPTTIDALVLTRKPLTGEQGLSSSTQPSLESAVLRTGPFTEEQYNNGVAAVRKAGRFTLKGLQDATGATPAAAKLIRDEMVQRGDLVEGSRPGTFKPYERPAAPSTQSPLKTHTVAPIASDTITVKKDGKVFGVYEDQVAAKDAVRGIREREKAEQNPPSNVQVVRGGVDAEGKAMAERPAFAVYENRYDADGNLVDRAIVSTHASEDTARTEADRLASRPTPVQTATNVSATRTPRPSVIARSRPQTIPTPKVVEGRLPEIIDRLNEQANRRALPLIGNRVKLVSEIVDKEGEGGIEGSYLNQLIELSVENLDPNMTTDQIVEELAGVMDHETIHALRGAGVLGPGTKAWQVLSRYVQDAVHPLTGKSYLETAFDRNPEVRGRPDVIVEEAIAEAFRMWAANKRAVTGVPRTVFEKIVEWFKRLVSSVPEDVFRSIETGSLARARIKAPMSYRGKAVEMMNEARAKMEVAQTPEEELAAQRDYLQAREQAAEDRVGRTGPVSVLGTTPSDDYMSGPKAASDRVDDLIEKANTDLKLSPTPNFGTPDQTFMMRLADAYQKAPHEPSNIAVQKAYSSLIAETKSIFNTLNVKVVPWRDNGQPYLNQRELLDDIANKGQVVMRISNELFPPHPSRRNHPMQEPSGITTEDGTSLSNNDLLRVAAEVYGYAPVGALPSMLGDYRAYHTLKGMYSQQGARALATEMLAQSAWHNAGPKMRLSDGSIAPPDTLGYVPPNKREFAEQKATLLPPEVLVEPAQEEIIDLMAYAEGEVRFSRMPTNNIPVNTVKAYKLFRTKKSAPGQLFPLFVDANTPVPIGEWVEAKAGEPGKNPSKVKSKLGDLAYRPGWHAGDLPIATHIGGRSHGQSTLPPDFRPDDQVWAEVEMPADVDWQSVANSRARVSTAGMPVASTAHITDQVPYGGHYRYKTNPNMTGNWIIGGAMKVNRVLSDAEVEAINSAAGTSDLPRLGGPRYSRGVNPQVNTPEFKAWFRDSKVVDEKGNPLVVYHGTPAKFTVFNPKKLGANTGADIPGIYFTTNPEVAEGYRGKNLFRKGQVLQVYLSMQNPRVVDATDIAPDSSAKWLIASQAQEDGFDGVIFKNMNDPARARFGEQRSDVYVVFEPTQVKSATDNTGAFSPTNPDIRYSRGDLKTRMQSNGDTPDRISTRQPTTKRGLAQQNPLTENLIIDLAAMKADPVKFAENMKIVKSYPGFRTTATDPNQIAEDFIDFVVGNLTYLHNRVPKEIRQRSKLWYDGARAITERWARQYNLPDYTISGVLAALSPQKDWYQNVSLGERVLDIYTSFTTGNNRAFTPTPEMAATAQRIYAKPEYAERVQTVLNGALMDMPTDITKAMWVRIYDETYNPRGFRTVGPEGDFVGEADGNVAWGSNVEIAKAISMIDNPTRENASERMGDKHKVRNFYNNILAPNAPWGDVTIDTHAVAAALIRPLSGSSIEVNHNFGTSPEKAKQPVGWVAAKNIADNGAQGTYGIYAEAYRRAAEQLGVLPRELQSITWEAIRGLFPAVDKRNAGKVQQVLNIWNAVKTGALNVEAARQQIEALAGGINDPTWFGPGSDRVATARDTSYEGELARARVQRTGAGQLGTARGYAGGAAEAAAGESVQRPDVRYSRGVKYGPAERSRLPSLSDKSRTYNVGSPEFYQMLDEAVPGGKYYGDPNRSAAAVTVPADVSAPNFSESRDGNVFFGGDIAYHQLQMTRDGDRGAVMTYMSPEDFLRLADQRPAREQDLYNVAVKDGYKFNTLPSLVVESGKVGNVPVRNSDGVAIVRALIGKVQTIPVVLYPSGNGQIENISTLEANGNVVEASNLNEFDIERRGPRSSLSSIAFNNWFKNSAVVDENGVPKRMYHNTKSDRNFDIFATRASEFGSHFGTVEQANEVAEKGHSYPVYLSVQNPIRLVDYGTFDIDVVTNQLREQGVITLEEQDRIYRNEVNGIVAIQDALVEKGYDGVVYLNRLEGFNPSEEDMNDDSLTDEAFKAKYPEAQDSYIVFQPTQVKSAIANRGTWSAADPDIRYSKNRNRRRVQSYGDAIYTAAQMKTDGLLGNYVEKIFRSKKGKTASIFNGRINFQDKAIPFKEFADRLNRNGVIIPATINAAMVEEQLGSAAAYQDRLRVETMRKPFLDAIKAAAKAKRFDYLDMNDFLYARHALERNPYLRSLKSPKPNPSGMSDGDAVAILAKLRARGVLDEITALSDKYVGAITKDITAVRIAGGMITPEQAAASPYKNWVPLRDTEDYDPFDLIAKGPRADGVGGAYTSSGRAPDPKTYGRNSKAGDIIANLFTIQSVTLVRAERAKVQKAFHESMKLPGAQAVIGDTLKLMPGVKKRLAYGADGLIREIVDPNFRNQPGVIVFKIDGQEIAYQTNDFYLERALKGPLLEPMNNMLIGLSTVTQKYTMLITTRNPGFTLPNLIRDYIEALIHSGQYKVPGLALGMTTRLPKSIKAIADYKLNEAKYKERLERGDTKGIDPMVVYYWEADKNGWLVSFLNYQDMSDRINRLHRDAGLLSGTRGNLAKIGKATESFFHAWDGVNDVFEGASRLSFYAAVRDYQKQTQKAEGRSDSLDAINEAGMAMKNLTINFNKGGRYKQAMNANFLFSSVILNGAAATGKLLKSKRGQAVLGSVIGLAFVLDMLNRALSDDDNDDGIPDYDVIPEYDLNRNLYIPFHKLGIPGITEPTKIPIALGPIGALFNFGRNASRALNGLFNPRQPVPPLAAVGRMFTSAADALNPFGDTTRPANIITPWYFDPVVDLWTNKNWADSNIVPPSYDETKPNSQRYYSTTDPIYIAVAQGMNKLAGGNEVRGSWFDFSPEQYKYIVDFALAGTGSFIMDSVYAVTEALPLALSGKPELIKPGKLPIVSRFDPTQVAERGARDEYFRLRDEVAVTKKELKSGVPETKQAGRERIAASSAVQGAFRMADKQLENLRKMLRAAQENRTMETAARLAKIEEIRAKMDDVMAKAVKRYYDAIKVSP